MIEAILLIIAFLSLIVVRLVPRSGRFRRVWYIFCIVNLSVVAVLSIRSCKNSHRVSDLEQQIVHVRDYSSIAQLDGLGNPPGYGIGSDHIMDNELTRLIKGTYTIEDEKISMERDASSEEVYRIIVKKFPKFPFGYFYLALCLRGRGDERWKIHAKDAIDILEKTTKIDGHHNHHDETLIKIKSWFQE